MTAGNFRTRLEAEALLQKIKADFPDAFIVRERFKYPTIGRADTRPAELPKDAKDVSLDEITDDGDIPAYKTRVNNWGKDPRPEYNTFSVRQSFTQSLMDQLGTIYKRE